MNSFHRKNLLFISISVLITNGCVSKNQFETRFIPQEMVQPKVLTMKKSWSKTPSLSAKDKDCLDCYATPNKSSKKPFIKKIGLNTYTQKKPLKTKYYGAYDYVEVPSDVKFNTDSYEENSYQNKNIVSVPSYTNSSYGGYSANMAIQIGAFRNYAGAEVYVRRYSSLSSKYNVAIETGLKNNKPLHRVRIEGFKNQTEAKKFISMNRLTDVFLVRK